MRRGPGTRTPWSSRRCAGSSRAAPPRPGCTSTWTLAARSGCRLQGGGWLKVLARQFHGATDRMQWMAIPFVYVQARGSYRDLRLREAQPALGHAGEDLAEEGAGGVDGVSGALAAGAAEVPVGTARLNVHERDRHPLHPVSRPMELPGEDLALPAPL